MSKVVELFRFAEASEIFTQVRNGSVAVVYNSETYLPATIGRGNIEQTQNSLKKTNLDT